MAKTNLNKSQEYLWMDTGNGFGSTSTKIRVMTNVRKSSNGQLFSYTNDAVNGLVITILKKCSVRISYTEQVSGINVGSHGVSLNASGADLTTNVESLALTKQVGATQVLGPAGTATYNGHSVDYIAEIGDVLRPHTNPAQLATSGTQVKFQITVLEI